MLQYVMKSGSERGSAIIMLFVAVALFGLISYVFLQGSGGSTSMITSEASKAAGYQSTDCANAVSMAVKRLEARGCGNMVSTLADGSNTNPGAPTDGSCSIYHPNGGGVRDCGLATSPADPCTTGPIGATCADGAFYIGDASGNRIYGAPADEAGTLQWKTTNTATTNTTSTSDGLANTDAMITAGASAHPAANACKAKSPSGTWYVPAKDELNLFWVNRVSINLPAKGVVNTGMLNFYWASTQGSGAQYGWVQRFVNGLSTGGESKTNNYRVRCVRR